jgi:hypothetical protein
LVFPKYRVARDDVVYNYYTQNLNKTGIFRTIHTIVCKGGFLSIHSEDFTTGFGKASQLVSSYSSTNKMNGEDRIE